MYIVIVKYTKTIKSTCHVSEWKTYKDIFVRKLVDHKAIYKCIFIWNIIN